jgi:hypothetical protein
MPHNKHGLAPSGAKKGSKAQPRKTSPQRLPPAGALLKLEVPYGGTLTWAGIPGAAWTDPANWDRGIAPGPCGFIERLPATDQGG